MGSNTRYKNIDRSWAIHEWRDGWNMILPPLFKSETLAEVEAEWPKIVAANPGKLLTFSKGYIMHKHPDTNWIHQPPIMPVWEMKAKG